MKCVDDAFLADANTIQNKFPICKEKNISIVFDGDDWKDDERYKKLQEAGLEVKFFPYTQGISSTQLREKLKG